MSSQNTNLKSNIVDIPLPKVAFNTHTMIELYEKCKESYNKLLDKKKNGVDESIQERADKKREDYVKAGVPEKDIEKYIKAFLKEETTNAKKLERLGGITISDDEMIKVYDKVIKYVKSYYYEITGGNYYFYNHDTETFDFKDDKYFKKEIDVKLELTLQILFSRNPDIYNIVSKIDKPRVYKMDGRFFINECRGMLHKNPKPFKKFSKETKENLNTMLEYIKEITCNNDSIFYEAYLKYLSQVCKGEKPQVIIYKKSEEGTGKSTESDFLINYVLGTGVCLVSGSTEPLTSNFNKILMGKLYVVFEELPTFSTAQWSAVSGKLKTLATEKTTVYRDCFEKAIQADNISNFVINTNVEAIKNTEGRRIIIAPINNSRIGDYAFFNNVRTQCFNLEVGECFYSYMLEKDTSEFFAENKEKGFPETEYKRIAIASLLSPTEKFLKFNYLLKDKGIDNIRPNDLYDEYKQYCISNDKKPLGKNEFVKSLERLDIKYISSNGKTKYKLPYEELKSISEKRKWLCQYDKDFQNDTKDDEPDFDDDATDSEIISKTSPLDADFTDYKYENSLLKKKIKELEAQLSLSP